MTRSLEIPSPTAILGRMREMTGMEGSVPAPLEISGEAFHVLVSTIISLRTRDAVTRPVSRAVLTRASDPTAMAGMDRVDLEGLLKPAGFYRQKAGQLLRIARMIVDRHDGRVPDSMQELLDLPGVGRKTANYVLGMVFGVPSICVDVHVHRISNRLGLVSTGDPHGTELALQEVFPRDWWIGINHTMVRFGQKFCRPVRPMCDECEFSKWCPGSVSGH